MYGRSGGYRKMTTSEKKGAAAGHGVRAAWRKRRVAGKTQGKEPWMMKKKGIVRRRNLREKAGSGKRRRKAESKMMK